MRACLRDTGRDRVVGQASSSFGSGSAVGGPRSDGDWIALYRDGISRYYGCEFTEIETLNLRTDQRGAPFDLPGCETPRDDEPDAITDTGVLAYVAQKEGRWSVVAFAPGGEQLDTGPPGSITNLRAEGSILRWENAGQPRSAEVEPAP
ncbi:MAG: hypothetical protein MSC31_04900 [Solirubrobacteraceae bacterium MAG38_C4-C5]|nr:hypothetical protein [Candidatus Siliceabacter maunaloa]